MAATLQVQIDVTMIYFFVVNVNILNRCGTHVAFDIKRNVYDILMYFLSKTMYNRTNVSA